MNNNDVERVAAALWNQNRDTRTDSLVGRSETEWSRVDNRMRLHYRRMARAALEAAEEVGA